MWAQRGEVELRTRTEVAMMIMVSTQGFYAPTIALGVLGVLLFFISQYSRR